jgi:threonyl-tRNA synthetase
VLSLTERTADYAKEIADSLVKVGIRAEADTRNEKLGYKIREAQLEKIPYMLIVGDKEAEDKTVSVRSRKDGDLGVMSIEELTNKLIIEDRTKKV